MIEFLAVGVGGFIGSCLRYGFTSLSNYMRWTFPMGTLMSNVLAGIAIGFIMGLEQQAVAIPARTRLFLTAGLLGGLSTFSTFSSETVLLFNNGKYMLAGANVLLNLCLSLSGVVLGMFLAKALLLRNR